MLIVHGDGASAESKAAELLARLASEYDSDLPTSPKVILEIFPSVQCFGQRTQDIDLLVFYADYRGNGKGFITDQGAALHSICATIELKGHGPEDVIFEGAQCSVLYNGERHDVTQQSEKQKHSVKNYIKQQVGNAPWIVNLIWLTRVNSRSLPLVASNLLGMDVTWQVFLNKAATLAGSNKENVVQTFSSRGWLLRVVEIFSRRLQASKIDRKRLEAITKNVLDRTKQQYAEKLGNNY